MIKNQKTDQHKHSQKLTEELKEQGEALHREINIIIQRKHSEIDEMNRQHIAAIEKQKDVINKAFHEIKHVIQDLKSLLDTGDVGLVSKYRSRIAEFRKMPTILKISLPNFLPKNINTEEILKQFGSLSPLSIETKEQRYTVPSSPPARPLLDGWRPRHLCSTSYGDLLVIMETAGDHVAEQTKLVRYSGSTERQSIQWNDQGKSLYSSGNYKYLCENMNLDICVADYDASAVVVDPWGICVDSLDNLFVAEQYTCTVKKIQYYQ
ncbi:uncharacterized protein LOC144624624 [Crassostrea virginica]